MNQQNYPQSNNGHLQQSQIINKKFRQFIHSRDTCSDQQLTPHKFTIQQTEVISKRFHQLCQNTGSMTYQQFRRGLGLLGREDSFICRIFNLIKQDGDSRITEQNYLNYLSIILKGNDLQKSRFGWLILTENKGDIQLKDFMDLFQQISVVWNALTGEIVTPKRKYVQQLFNTFDVDQDQAITFHDYRLFFNQHLQLPGWFEYFNGIELNEQISRTKLQKVREKLRSKLKIDSNKGMTESPEELRMWVQDSEITIQKKLLQLTKNMKQSSEYIQQKRQQVKLIEHSHQDHQSEMERSIYDFSHKSPTLNSVKSNHTTSDQGSVVSLKSLYKYNHEMAFRSSSINKIQLRRQKLKNQTKATLNTQITRDLKGFLQNTYRLMELCQNYRTLKQKQKKYSPTKLKQMQVKLNLVDKQVQHQQLKEGKKKMTVYFGHQNWNLVLNIMVGLRKSIKSLYQLNNVIEIKQSHFTQQHQFFLGNKAFLSGKGPQALKNMESFQFIQMAPLVFQRLRNQYGVSNNEYQRSVGPQGLLNQLLTGDLTALNQKCSTGKSGAFFYLTSDNRIFLKTLTKDQYVFYTRIVNNYYKHMIQNPNTLIVRIYGLYKLKVFVNKQKVNTIYFISMENIFSKIKPEQKCSIQQIYDLKGSLYGRTGADDNELKDQDWMQRKKKIQLPHQLSEIFRQQITLDSKFFKKNNINDYSLMVAFVKYQGDQKIQNQGNLFKRVNGGVLSRVNGQLYILSIIDILTAFQTKKTLQYLFKSTFLSKDVSCVPPSDYCHRFRQFIHSSID